MKKRDIKNILIFIVLFIYIYIYKTILINKYLHLEQIISPIILIIISFISVLLLGIRKTPDKILEKHAKNLLLYEIVVYFLITYGIGIFVGFLRNSYSLEPISILKHIISPIFFILTTEILRNIVIQANKDKKYPIVIITAIIIILELLMSINSYKISTTEGMFRLIASSLIPLIAKHHMLSYLSYKTGIKLPLVYRLIFDLYIYIAPIFPSFGESIQAIINIVFNEIVYLSMYKLANERAYKEHNFKTKKLDIIDLAYSVFVIIIVALVSGLFKYTLIAVGSDSMSPTFNKGDAVFINQKPTKEELKKGDIVFFEHQGKPIIHRIEEIKTINNIEFYYTKGDANNVGDEIPLTYKDIKGEVKLIVPYVGYFSILIEEYR
ncbi:MAG: signal peptidase I [Bacilli bacterium]|nr:signal peptidase I [Bacilli bacterium]